MKLLLNESPLLVLPTLAVKLGLNEAIVLQQLHFRLLQSPLKYDGFTWYHHTYTKWREQFPFWSEKTISRAFLSLERKGIIVSSQAYNAMKVNKTKWYRIDYDVLSRILERQIDFPTETDCEEQTEQFEFNEETKMADSVKKERNKEKQQNTNLEIMTEIIHYLNNKAYKEFRINNQATKRLINARLQEGYTVEDFKKVIDVKVSQWLNNKEMRSYLRPSTLFSPTNFENYLNEARDMKPSPVKRTIQPIVLDYNAGEEDE